MRAKVISITILVHVYIIIVFPVKFFASLFFKKASVSG